MIATLASVLDRARAYLAAMPPAIAGHNGHGLTFAAACALVNGFALEPETALALLREYSSRCVPPWAERELLHKISSAIHAAHLKPRGHLLGGTNAFSLPLHDSLSRPKIIPAA